MTKQYFQSNVIMTETEGQLSSVQGKKAYQRGQNINLRIIPGMSIHCRLPSAASVRAPVQACVCLYAVMEGAEIQTADQPLALVPNLS